MRKEMYTNDKGNLENKEQCQYKSRKLGSVPKRQMVDQAGLVAWTFEI